MNIDYTLDEMTTWTNDQLELLCKPENHKIIFDGYEYKWYHKLDGNKWDLHSVYTFEDWKKPYSWLKWAMAAWAKELEARRATTAKDHLKEMKEYLFKVEKARAIADSKLKTKDKIQQIQMLLPDESITFIADLLRISRQAVHKHL